MVERTPCEDCKKTYSVGGAWVGAEWLCGECLVKRAASATTLKAEATRHLELYKGMAEQRDTEHAAREAAEKEWQIIRGLYLAASATLRGVGEWASKRLGYHFEGPGSYSKVHHLEVDGEGYEELRALLAAPAAVCLACDLIDGAGNDHGEPHTCTPAAPAEHPADAKAGRDVAEVDRLLDELRPAAPAEWSDAAITIESVVDGGHMLVLEGENREVTIVIHASNNALFYVDECDGETTTGAAQTVGELSRLLAAPAAPCAGCAERDKRMNAARQELMETDNMGGCMAAVGLKIVNEDGTPPFAFPTPIPAPPKPPGEGVQ